MGIFPIPWQDTLQGCMLSIENAERLVEDAFFLNRNGRTQSAYCVSLDAWEELGKAILLYKHYKTKEPVSQQDWRHILLDHKHKHVAWMNNDDLLYGRSPSKSVAELKDALEKTIKERDSLTFKLDRDIGAYVDWIGGDHRWRSPCKLEKPWFSSDQPMPPVFDPDYWAISTHGICKHLRRLIGDSEGDTTYVS